MSEVISKAVGINKKNKIRNRLFVMSFIRHHLRSAYLQTIHA